MHISFHSTVKLTGGVARQCTLMLFQLFLMDPVYMLNTLPFLDALGKKHIGLSWFAANIPRYGNRSKALK